MDVEIYTSITSRSCHVLIVSNKQAKTFRRLAWRKNFKILRRQGICVAFFVLFFNLLLRHEVRKNGNTELFKLRLVSDTEAVSSLRRASP